MRVFPTNPEEIYRKGRTVLFLEQTSRNPAVIFDLDMTLLYFRETDDFAEEKRTYIIPVPPMISLWNMAKQMGYKCYIITARTDMDFTIRHLNKIGVYGWEAVFVRENDNTCPWVSKAEARDWVYSRHTVALNVGDSVWDIGRDASTEFAGGIEPDPEPVASFLVNTIMMV